MALIETRKRQHKEYNRLTQNGRAYFSSLLQQHLLPKRQHKSKSSVYILSDTYFPFSWKFRGCKVLKVLKDNRPLIFYRQAGYVVILYNSKSHLCTPEQILQASTESLAGTACIWHLCILTCGFVLLEKPILKLLSSIFEALLIEYHIFFFTYNRHPPRQSQSSQNWGAYLKQGSCFLHQKRSTSRDTGQAMQLPRGPLLASGAANRRGRILCSPSQP